jgi:hypothetical protein
MAKTQVRSLQIEDQGIWREDLNTTTSGKAIITKIVAGTGISISSTGVDDGTGDVTINATATGIPVLDNDSYIQWRNALDTVDLDVIKLDTNNQVVIEPVTNFTSDIIALDDVRVHNSINFRTPADDGWQHNISNDSNGNLRIGTTGTSDGIIIGTNTAAEIAISSFKTLKLGSYLKVGESTDPEGYSFYSSNQFFDVGTTNYPFRFLYTQYVTAPSTQLVLSSSTGRVSIIANGNQHYFNSDGTVDLRNDVEIGSGTSNGELTVHRSILMYQDEFGIFSTTSDGSDNRMVAFSGAGKNGNTEQQFFRGSYILSYGNEHSEHPGTLRLGSGLISGGKIEFLTNTSVEAYFDGSTFAPGTNRGCRLGTVSTNHWGDAYIGNDLVYDTNDDARIFINTTSGSDNRHLTLMAANSYTTTRSALIRICGEQDGNAGDVFIYSGNSGKIRLFTGSSAERWQIDSSGHFIPIIDSTYNIGSPTQHVSTLYVDNIVGVSLGGGVNPNDTYIQWRNAADTADLDAIKVNTSDLLYFNLGSVFANAVTFNQNVATILDLEVGDDLLLNDQINFRNNADTAWIHRIDNSTSDELQIVSNSDLMLSATTASGGLLRIYGATVRIHDNWIFGDDNDPQGNSFYATNVSYSLGTGTYPFNYTYTQNIQNPNGTLDLIGTDTYDIRFYTVNGGSTYNSYFTDAGGFDLYHQLNTYVDAHIKTNLIIEGTQYSSTYNGGIYMDTADASDTKAFVICAGGYTNTNIYPDRRGATLWLYGNEHTTEPGTLHLYSGDVTNALIKFSIDGSERFFMSSNAFYANSTYTLGTSTNYFGRAYIGNELHMKGNNDGKILVDTVDGSDTESLQLAGAGSTSSSRGASITLYGEDNGQTGAIYFISGASGRMLFNTGNQYRWELGNDGHWDPLADDTYDIGQTSRHVRDIYTNRVTSTGNTTISLITQGAASLVFGTNDTNRWNINSSGNIAPFADLSYDIGNTSYKVNRIYVAEVLSYNSNLRLNAETSSSTEYGVEIANDSVVTWQFGEDAFPNRFKQIGSLGDFQYNADQFYIHSDTADNTDTKSILISGGGYVTSNHYNRGGYIECFGNEHTTGNGGVNLVAGDSDSLVSIYNRNNERFHFAVGEMYPAANNSYDLGIRQTNHLGRVYVGDRIYFTNLDNGEIVMATDDGSDNRRIAICGGGEPNIDRGAFIEVFGQEDSPSGIVRLNAGRDSQIDFYTQGSQKWRIETDGHLVPGADSSYNIGDPSYHVDTLYVDNIVGVSLGGGVNPNNTYLQWRNAADTADVDVIKLDTNDECYIATNLVVAGNIQVDGSQTILNTTVVEVEDTIITLNKNFTTGTPTADTGIEALRGSSTTASLIFDESEDYWAAGLQGTESKIILASDNISDLSVLPNNTYVQARNNANTADVDLLRLTTSDELELDPNILLNGKIKYSSATFDIAPTTSDGSDSAVLQLMGGGTTDPSRGASIRIHGNEHSPFVGSLLMKSGNASGGAIILDATASNGIVYLQTGSTTRWQVSSAGHFVPGAGSTYDIGTQTNRVNDIYSDALRLKNEGYIWGRNAADTAYVALMRFSSVNELQIGSTSVGYLTVDFTNDFRIRSGGTQRWTFSAAGDLVPYVTETYDIGSTARKVNEIHVKKVVVDELEGNVTFNEETGTTVSAEPDKGYIASSSSQCVITLPSTIAVGERVRVAGEGSGGWKVAQNTGQTIHFGSSDTTTGTSGSLESNNQYDCVELLCVSANTDFVVISSMGNITVN